MFVGGESFFFLFSLSSLFSLSFLYVGDRFHISLLCVYVVRVYKFIHRLFIKLLQNYYIVRVRACYFTLRPKATYLSLALFSCFVHLSVNFLLILHVFRRTAKLFEAFDDFVHGV